jgi:hypothetical protein
MERVEERLSSFLAEEHDRWSGVDVRAARPVDAVADLVAAGG